MSSPRSLSGNPHLVALVDKYVESDLIAMGERVATRPDVFPAGANLSVLLQLEPAEVFVRTFERGAGLTASCGSGMAAARAVYSRITPVDPARRVTVRNAGGMATVSLNVRQGRWHPVLEGNATFVYRAEVDPAALARDAVEPCDDEVRAYAALDERNAARLREAGVTGSDHPGSRTVRVPGHTETVSARPGATISPSICLGRTASALTWTRRACRHSSARSWRRPRASTRPASRIQSQPPDGARMPTSSRPSSSLAAGSRVNPPGSSPALATTTDRARRRSGSAPSGADGELARRQRQPPHPGRRVGGPAEPPLEPLARRRHHGGVQADAGHGGEPGPARAFHHAARSIAWSRPPKPASTARPPWDGHAQRPRGQVRGAQRHDGQRHAGAGQRLGAGPDRAVAARREHQARPGGHRAAGQGQAVLRPASRPEPRVPAAIGRRGPAAQQEPPRIAEQRPVDHERDQGHAPIVVS